MAKRKKSTKTIVYNKEPFTPDQDGDTLGFHKGRIEVGSQFLKIFFDSIGPLVRLDQTSIKLFLFLCREANDSNSVSTGQITIDKFISLLQENQIEMTARNVQKTLKKLESNHFLISLSRGERMINPLFFFKASDEKKRFEAIKKFMEKKHAKDKEYFESIRIPKEFQGLFDGLDSVTPEEASNQ